MRAKPVDADVPAAQGLPSWSAAANARNLASAALRLAYRLDVHGAHHLGGAGGLLIVARTEAVLAGSILQAIAPRPVHVIANAAMQAVVPERAMRAAGAIPVSGPAAIAAQRQGAAALRDGRAVAVAGSAVPLGFLAATTGVPVAPVVVVGAEGRVVTDPPRPRTRISVYAFEPIAIDVHGDPLRPATRAAVEEQIRQAVADAEAQAGLRSGRLPA